MRISSLYRYPVKGLSPERLPEVEMTAGGYFPGDRLFAIENGPSGFDPAQPEHQPKIKFLMLMRNESLARLKTRYLDSTGELAIEEGGREVARADLASPQGRLALRGLFPPLHARRTQRRTEGAVGALRLPVHRFPPRIRVADQSGERERVGELIGAPVDPLRFRGNILLDGLDPWAEFDLVGGVIAAGPVRLRIIKRIERCAATNVDPANGLRDLQIPKALMHAYGHFDCGVYAEILSGGPLSEGAVFSREPQAQEATSPA